MRPYRITGMTLVDYDGRESELQVLDSEIIRRPLKAVTEELLDAFSGISNPPVKIKLKLKYI